MALKSNLKSAKDKYNMKILYPPDGQVITSLKSMRQNPKFARLLGFALGCFQPLLCPPNPRHRDNVKFLQKEGGYKNFIQAIEDHIDNDSILLNTTTLLTKMVGTGKFRDEEIAQMIVSEGAIEKLLKALNHPSEKSKKTIKAILELLDLLTSFNGLSLQLVQLGTVETLYNVIQQNTQSQNATFTSKLISKIINTITLIAGDADALNFLMNPDIIKKTLEVLQAHSDNELVAEAGLKLLVMFSKSKIGRELLQNGGHGLKCIVEILNKHPNDQQIIQIGKSVLGRVATIKDLQQALDGINGNDSEYCTGLLSQLVMLDEMMDNMDKSSIVQNLIDIINQVSQSQNISEVEINVLKRCCLALSRIAQTDETQILPVNYNASSLIFKLCQQKHIINGNFEIFKKFMLNGLKFKQHYKLIYIQQQIYAILLI